MSKVIKIKAGSVEAVADIFECKTAEEIWNALPISARANTWGDEIYFSIPVSCSPENPKAVVEEGDLGYWPPGSAFCIFWGPTPASHGNEIRPASPVNVFGKVRGDAKIFNNVSSGEEVIIEKFEE